MTQTPKVALIHDWLTGMRGGEYVLEAISELFPSADLFTLIHLPGKVSPTLERHKIYTSWMQKIPGVGEKYRHFLPIMPLAAESFDLSAYDLVISSSHCVAKGVKKRRDAVHVSYVHAPMRYIWDRFEDYFSLNKVSLPVRLAALSCRKPLQAWDKKVSSEKRVDHLLANSAFIAQQIEKAYGRKAQVVYPFSDLSRFKNERKEKDFYLMVGAFAPYKKTELAIEAFNRMKLPLWIVGSGQDESRLKPLAGNTVRFLGALSNEEIAKLYSECRAFVFPALEDFGITPLEAMASGAPVIAFGEGGASESVSADAGLLFKPQSVEALMAAVQKIESGEAKFTPEECKKRAALFTKDRFKKEFFEAVRATWERVKKQSLLTPGS